MIWDPALNPLRDTLASLYVAEDDTRRVIASAGLDERHIEITGKAINNWTNILKYAFRHGKIDAVIREAKADYKINADLAAAIEYWHAHRQPVYQALAPYQDIFKILLKVFGITAGALLFTILFASLSIPKPALPATPTPLIFPRAASGERLLILIPYSGKLKSAEFAPERLVRDALETRLKRMEMQGYKVRLEQWNLPVTSARQARQIGMDYKAILVIWGEFDDVSGLRTYVELMGSVPQPDTQQSGKVLPVASLPSADEQTIEIGHYSLNCLTDSLVLMADYLTTLSLGIVQLSERNWAEAEVHFTQAIEIDISKNARNCFLNDALAYYWRGLTRSLRENFPSALKDFDQALARDEKLTLAWAQRGTVHLALGELDASQLDYRMASGQLFPEDKRGYAVLSGNMGVILELQGKYAEAETYYRNALELNQSAGNAGDQAFDWLHLGNLALRRGQMVPAREYLNTAFNLYRNAGNQQGQAVVLGNRGLIEYEQQHYPEALDYFSQALTITRSLGDRSGQARQWMYIGQVYLKQQKLSEARNAYAEAESLCTATGSPYCQARVYIGMGMVAANANDLKQVQTNWEQALQLLESIGSPDAAVVRQALQALK